MAAQLPPTLGQLRSDVLDRCGLAQTGNIPRNIQAIIDSKIRSAQRQLYELAPWLMNLVERDVTLVEDTTEYDIPDDTEPGMITFVAVRRIEDGFISLLEPGIRPDEPNTLSQQPRSMPTRYQFVNNTVRVLPTPDTTRFDVLRLVYYQTPPAFVQDSERAVVDGEALLMLAEILVKEHFGGQETDRLRADLGTYVERRKMKQGTGDGLQMGGRQSWITRTQRRNRFAWSGAASTSWNDWRPW